MVIQGAYKLSEDFAKPYFHKYWTEIHDVITIWKRNVCSFIVTWMKTCRVDGLVVQRTHTTPSAPGHPGHHTWQCVISSYGVSSRSMFTSHHFQRHYQNCESASTPQPGTSHKTCLRGFGGNGSIAWTSAVSHEGRTSNAFKVTMKLQTLLFQMVVT